MNNKSVDTIQYHADLTNGGNPTYLGVTALLVGEAWLADKQSNFLCVLPSACEANSYRQTVANILESEMFQCVFSDTRIYIPETLITIDFLTKETQPIGRVLMFDKIFDLTKASSEYNQHV